jgi:hypothetical protein
MSVVDAIGVTWGRLAERLDGADALSGWAAAEPDLAGVGSVAGLTGVVCYGADPDRVDAVFGALVRLAAADGGDQADAVLVLLHLLGPGAGVLARGLRDLSPDIDVLVVGELALQIRGFPWRRRGRAYAASLLLDARRALLRELRPDRGREVGGRVMPVEHGSLLRRYGPRLMRDAVPDRSGDGQDVRGAVLAWALRAGLVDAGQVALLVELAAEGHGGRLRVAARYGVSERTVRRRRDRAVAALRAAYRLYVAGGGPAGTGPVWPASAVPECAGELVSAVVSTFAA